MKIEQLSQDQIKSLSLLEKPEWLKFYDEPDLERTRQLEFLHPFRAPGFPDDRRVLIVYFQTANKHLFCQSKYGQMVYSNCRDVSETSKVPFTTQIPHLLI
jgi:hypothetical protein